MRYVVILSVLTAAAAYAGTLTVGGGTAEIPEGTLVTLRARAPADGEVFDRWTGDTAGIADITQPTTTLTMAAGNVSIQATYKPDPTLPPPPPAIPPLGQVMAAMETASALDPDDMWLWRHPTSPGDSMLIVSDKGSSHVRWYDLRGNQIGLLAESGRPNGVDGRGNLFACTLRNSDAVGFYQVDGVARSVTKVGAFLVGFDPYGITCYRSPASGKLYLFVSESLDCIFQYEVDEAACSGKLVRTIATTLVEGMVVHEPSRRLFYAEEDRNLCVIDAEPDPAATSKVIGAVGSNGLAADLEGLALVSDLYLLVSSQGRSEFAVFELRAPTYYYRGNFAVKRLSGPIDSVGGTDGIAWYAGDFGGSFRSGIFFCHDGGNDSGGANIKAVPWERIAQALALEVP